MPCPFQKVVIWLEKLVLGLRPLTWRGSQEKMLRLAGGESWSSKNNWMGHPPMRIMGRFFIWEILNMPA